MSRGSFAEYAAAREDKLAHKPANASFEQAATVGISGGTALQALKAGRVAAGQRVLIIGASGGVGSYAVQLAKAAGAEVTGVCSTNKTDLVTSLGADHVIDYTRDDFADGAHHYDLIIDIAGNSPLSRLRRALTPTGTAVIVGGESKGNITGGIGRQLRALILTPFIGQRLTGLASKERATDSEVLAQHIGAGTVTPSIDRTYPLDQVPTAMRHLEARHGQGKDRDHHLSPPRRRSGKGALRHHIPTILHWPRHFRRGWSLPCRKGNHHDRSGKSQQAIWHQARRGRTEFRRPTGHRHRFPRPERRREIHHDADDRRPGPTDHRTGHRQRW